MNILSVANAFGQDCTELASSHMRRRAVACTYCRSKKIRCNGSTPCSNCVDHDKACVIARPRRQRLSQSSAERKSGRVETQAQEKSTGGLRQNATPAFSESNGPLVFVQDNFQGYFDDGLIARANTTPATADGEDAPQDDSNGIYVAHAPSHEYFGPTSFLSLCSRPGIDWVNSRTLSKDFEPVATNLMAGMAQGLKIQGIPTIERAPAPQYEDAWSYSAQYFANASEAAFGIVDQVWFNARLEAHFDGARDDHAWYALRNALWASGCRIALHQTKGFREAKRASWVLFENALSSLSYLLLYSSSVVGVQALTLMAYFSDGLSSPSLQYMLTSNAMRLACSMGLHREPASSWNMSQGEVGHRSRLFWAIYCLEKQTVSRSDRPSMIHDEDVSCSLSANASEPVYCRLLVDLSQLCSKIRKRLSNRQNVDAGTICALSSELEQFRSRTANTTGFDLSGPLDMAKLPSSLDSGQALTIYCFYYCLTLDVNNAPLRPWTNDRSSANEQIQRSTSAMQKTCRMAVVQACRCLILASRNARIDANCSCLVGAFGLIYASLSLFTHILQAAHKDASRSELLLLDIAIGCSSTLEFETEGERSFPFLKDLRRIAEAAIERRCSNKLVSDTPLEPTQAQQQTGVGLDTISTAAPQNNDCPLFEMPLAAGGQIGDDLEMWSTLLQLPEPRDLIDIPW